MRRLIASIVFVAAASACGQEEARPERPVEVATDVPTVAPTAMPGNLPTGPAPIYANGVASVKLSGEVKRTLELPLGEGLPATYSFGVISGAWGTIGGDLLTIAGTASLGGNETGKDLILFLSLSKPTAALSSGPGCTLTIDRADEEGLEGSFSCPGMKGGGVTADAEGTFSAKA